jgi:hypothetical protein
MYCDGFRKSIDTNDDRFKNFLRLITLRNDYVHANIVATMQQHLISTDGHTFLLYLEESGIFPTNIEWLNFPHVELAKKYVDEMIDLITENLKQRQRKSVREMIQYEQIEIYKSP